MVQPLLLEQQRLNDRRAIVKELLSSFGEEMASADRAGQPAHSPMGGRETVRERVHREVVEVFTSLGRPLHINDLHQEMIRRGHVVPGQGKPANISVHLSGWPDVVSPERGIYGLTTMFDSTPPSKSHSTGRRKRKGAR